MRCSTPFGENIDIPIPPAAINVEIYPDYDEDDESQRTKKQQRCSEWSFGSLANNGHIVIPISISHKNKIRMKPESIRAQGGAIRFRASRVQMANYFPIELGLCIVVEKAQVSWEVTTSFNF